MAYSNSQIFLAELLGTFIFLCIGNGGICNALLPGTKGHGLGYLGIAMNFGLAVYIALQCVGHVSPFFNPAVALGAAVRGDISWSRMWVSTAAEFLGAFLASLFLYVLYLPHFQPLALVGDWDEEDTLMAKSAEGTAVAVIRQELKGSAKRYASHGNMRTNSGIKLQAENERAHPFLKHLKACWADESQKVQGGGLQHKVVSSADMKKVQVDPSPSAAKPSTIAQRIEADQEIKLVVFATRPSSTHLYWIFAPLAEMFGTAVLTFGAFAFDDRIKVKLAGDAGVTDLFFNGLQPFLVALLLIGIIVSCGGITGPALNPIKDLPPRLVHWLMPIPGKGSSEWWYAWVPVLGPCAGGVLGALLSDAMRSLTKAGL